MENLPSWTKPLVLRGLILIGTVVLIILIINASVFDEALDPKVAQIMATPAPVSLEGNAYTLLTGLSAASDRDPTQVGKLIIAEFRRLSAAKQAINISAEKFTQLLGGRDLDAAWRERYDSLSCTPRRELGCIAKLKAERMSNASDNARLQSMLTRYEKIIEFDTFVESDELDFSSQLPPYGLLMNLSKLYLTDRQIHGNHQEFISALEKDMRFWKLLLRDGKSLIAKMVGIAGIWTDLQIISEYLAAGDLQQEEIVAFKNLLTPLTSSEQNIGETFISEFRYVFAMKDFHFAANQMSSVKRLLINATYQENATLNEYYRSFLEPIINLSQGKAENFLDQTSSLKGSKPSYRLFPPTIYNLGGKMLIHETRYEAKDYVSRSHDLAGFISLVNLQLELEGSVETTTTEIINNSAYRNPYTGQAMEYNQSKSTLGFDCVSPGNLCELNF